MNANEYVCINLFSQEPYDFYNTESSIKSNIHLYWCKDVQKMNKLLKAVISVQISVMRNYRYLHGQCNLYFKDLNKEFNSKFL